MCRQSHQLVEPLIGEECVQLIGRLPPWADVEVAHDKGGLLGVDELLQEMCGPGWRFFL